MATGRRAVCKTPCMPSWTRRTVLRVPFADRLTAVLPPSDPLGRSAARWAGLLSERAGEPVPYAFALAVARQLAAPGATALGIDGSVHVGGDLRVGEGAIVDA